MLDENEFAEASRLYRECAADIKDLRRRAAVSLEDAGTADRFRPLRDWYRNLTGVPDCHQDAILHHRLSLIGPACRACGKPLRSPRAQRCAACGEPV